MAFILIVDDDAEVRETTADMLSDSGHSVLAAADGVEAMMMLETHPGIELVFTDLAMPRLDGLQLADMVKLSRPEIKLLYATGNLAVIDARAGVMHGQVLQKPYFRGQLEAAVARLLRVPDPDPAEDHPVAAISA